MKAAFAILVLLLVGCASLPPGVEASPEELQVCKDEGGCSIWTNDELKRLFNTGVLRGYMAGRSKGT